MSTAGSNDRRVVSLSWAFSTELGVLVLLRKHTARTPKPPRSSGSALSFPGPRPKRGNRSRQSATTAVLKAAPPALAVQRCTSFGFRSSHLLLAALQDRLGLATIGAPDLTVGEYKRPTPE